MNYVAIDIFRQLEERVKIIDNHTELALRTWYHKDHPLHLNPHHPALGLAGEVGEWLNLWKKDIYKPNCSVAKADEIIELGDQYYYSRILHHQHNLEITQDCWTGKGIKSIGHLRAMMNILAGDIYLATEDGNGIHLDFIDIFQLHFNAYIKIQNTTLDEIAEQNWEKLKPGSERGEEWGYAAREGL